MGTWEEHKDKGNDAYKKGDMEAANEHYTEALGSDDIPDDKRPVVLTNRAQVNLKRKEYNAVVEDCSAALVFDEKNLKALFRRGTAYEALGRKDDAVGDFKAVLAINPTTTMARESLRRLDPSAPELKVAISAPRGVGGTSVGTSASRGTGSSSGAVSGQPTKENILNLGIAEAKVKTAQRQISQTRARKVAAEQRLRSLRLQSAVMQGVTDDQRTFRASGRAFLLCPADEMNAKLATDAKDAEKRIEVATSTMKFLDTKLQEAQESWVEAYNDARRSMGLPAVKPEDVIQKDSA